MCRSLRSVPQPDQSVSQLPTCSICGRVSIAEHFACLLFKQWITENVNRFFSALRSAPAHQRVPLLMRYREAGTVSALLAVIEEAKLAINPARRDDAAELDALARECQSHGSRDEPHHLPPAS